MANPSLSSCNETVYIGLGANLGERRNALKRAVAFICAQREIEHIATSTFRETAPWGRTDQPPFINGAVAVRTLLSPDNLLKLLKDGEQQLGRTPTYRWGPRVVDMDILLFGSRVVDTPHLRIPHAELTRRTFVLAPLLELNPTLRHPVSDIPLKDYFKKLTQGQVGNPI